MLSPGSSQKNHINTDRNIEILTNKLMSLDFESDKIVEIDLGCGKGTFAVHLAQSYRDSLIYASDLMLGRLRKLRNRKESLGLKNLNLIRIESRTLVYNALPDSSINRIHILCPDPWPKTRHSSRRLMCSDFIGRLGIVLKPGGVVHFSTDDKKYFDFVLRIFECSDIFMQNVKLIEDILMFETDFEKLWRNKGLKIYKTGFLKKSGSNHAI